MGAAAGASRRHRRGELKEKKRKQGARERVCVVFRNIAEFGSIFLVFSFSVSELRSAPLPDCRLLNTRLQFIPPKTCSFGCLKTLNTHPGEYLCLQGDPLYLSGGMRAKGNI